MLMILLVVVIGSLLVLGVISNAYAAKLTVYLDPDTDLAWPTFTAQKVINLSYDAGVALPSQSNGKNENITFTVNATGNGINQLISAFNHALAAKHNPVRVISATVRYSADLIGEGNRAIISYKITVLPSITKYVIQKNGPQDTVIDLNWRSLTVSQPIVIDTLKYGKVNINYPIGLLQVIHPQLAKQLLNSSASSIMQSPILDFQQIGESLDSWHFLFDPTGSIMASIGLLSHQPGSRAVSVYALGQSSLREAVYIQEGKDAFAIINGQTIIVHSSTSQAAAEIGIAGFSKIHRSGGGEFAYVTDMPGAITGS
jgi:hypothetical protein